MSAPGRTRLYREFLTPALHRRFTTAAGLTLLICYGEAVIIGEKSSCKLQSRSVLFQLTRPIRSSLALVSHRTSWYSHTSSLPVCSFGVCPPRGAAAYRCEEHCIAFRNLPPIPFPIQHHPDSSMVLLLSMVVQRGLRVVSAK